MIRWRRIGWVSGGFVFGYTYAFLSALIASKKLGRMLKLPSPHPVDVCAGDCPWSGEHNPGGES